MKSFFELLISAGVIQLDDEEHNTEEGDQAVLSKKPLGPNWCASCEKNLPSLSSNPPSHTSWNHLPKRDPYDRLAKAGQGFSRILQSVRAPHCVEEESSFFNHNNQGRGGIGGGGKLN